MIIRTNTQFYFFKVKEWISKYEGDEEKWLDNVRVYMVTIAGMIMTMSFAACLAMPGGVVSAAIGNTIENAEDLNINKTIFETGKNAFHSTINSTIHVGETKSTSIVLLYDCHVLQLVGFQ